MRPRPSILGKLAAPIVTLAAIVLNQATGGHAFTQFPSADLARMKSYESAADLVFRDPILDADRSPPPTIDNSFHFGWVPSGFSPQAASVLTVAVLAFATSYLWSRRAPTRAHPPASGKGRDPAND